MGLGSCSHVGQSEMAAHMFLMHLLKSKSLGIWSCCEVLGNVRDSFKCHKLQCSLMSASLNVARLGFHLWYLSVSDIFHPSPSDLPEVKEELSK